MTNVAIITRQYAEGRICISSDRLGKYLSNQGGSQTFWRKTLEWVGQKYPYETITIGVINSSNIPYQEELNGLSPVLFQEITTSDIVDDPLDEYDLLYFIGLPTTIPDLEDTIETYVKNGGGLLIEVPDRVGEIEILHDIDPVYCLSVNRDTFSNAYWTVPGQNHYIYTNPINIGFLSTIDTSRLSSEWSFLMADIPVVGTPINYSNVVTTFNVGSEFGVGYTIAMQNGFVELNVDPLSISTLININNVATQTISIPQIEEAQFNFLDNKVYSATKIQQIYGSFVSNVIDPSSSFLKWYEVTWEEYKDNKSSVWMLVKTSDTQEGLTNAVWLGPFIDGLINMDGQYGRYFQFCFVIKKDINSSIDKPKVGNIQLKYYTTDASAKFFTKSFYVGFTPKSIVLTCNADITDDAVIRFAISGIDTSDVSYYQYFEPNNIIKLDSISYLSDSVKVMMEIIGTSESQVVVNEFALMISGEDAYRINKNDV